jgi:hypothetical protein
MRDGVFALLPVVASLAFMTSLTLWRAGAVPDLVTYLDFLSVYNMLNDFWAIVAGPRFFGWIAMLLAAFIVLSDAWTRVLRQGAALTRLDDTIVLQRFAPMAMLLLLQAAYFVGRSVDYTLDLALFPFCAIAIAGGLEFSATTARERGPVRLLLVVPVAALLLGLGFVGLTLLRPAAPYLLVLHECAWHDRCAPGELAVDLRGRLKLRSVLEKVGHKRGDYWYDKSGIVREALSMIEKWAPDEPRITVLLGHLIGGDDMVSDVVLMYAGKWHRWPGRSWTFSDRLVPRLTEKIIDAPVKLREGELVLVRREAAELKIVEAGIWRRIQAEYSLCELPTGSKLIAAYRIAGAACRSAE